MHFNLFIYYLSITKHFRRGNKYKQFLTLVIVLFLGSQSSAQEESRLLRLGFGYGIGTQQIFPYNNPDYTYDVRGYKGLINYRFKKGRIFSYELQLEPGIYKARHQLLNEYFVQPEWGADYLEKREIFMQEKTITEYAFNIGLQVRHNFNDRISIFILGSTGPMYSDTETERLAKGFAFSDIFAIGISYTAGKFMFELRPGVRHVSNLNTQFPNSGHNSSNIDFGISVIL